MARESSHFQRLYWIDFMRVVAIFLVIFIHVSADLLYGWGKVSPGNWMIGNIYDSLARVSVPLLFMISGFLLLGKNEPVKDFFLKRSIKVLIPFIAWTLIYLFWRCNVNGGVCTKKVITRLILFEGTAYHLWFLYVLLGLYLITPFLRIITTSGQKRILWYLVALWLVFQTGVAILDKVWGLSLGITVPMATGYIGYFVLGHLLSEIQLGRGGIVLSLITCLAGIIATAAGTYFISSQAGKFDGFFYEYLSLNVIVASISAFLLLKSLATQNESGEGFFQKAVTQLAAGTFGIYLIHVMILDIIGGRIPLIHFNVEMGNPVWSIPLVSVVAFFASFCAVYVLQKIPFLNRIVP